VTLSIRRICAALRRIHSEDAGLSMAEVVVALMVFAILATSVAYGLLNSLTLTQHSRARETALALASQDLDAMRLRALNTKDGILQINSTATPVTQVVGGTRFSLDRDVNWADTTGALGACGTGTGTLAFKSVVDTVSWQLAAGAPSQSVKMATSVAPIGNINTDTTGTIIIAAIGSDGSPEPGLSVSISAVSGGAALATPPAATDSDGCSFGLKAQPGTYQVSVTRPGGIDIAQTDPSVNKSVVVKAGQNTMVNFSYDTAATFALAYPAGAAVATNMTTTFYYPSSGASKFANAPTTVKAFPWQDGYQIMAGTYVPAVAGGPATCTDTNPSSWTTVAPDGAIGSPLDSQAVGAGQASVAPYPVVMGKVTVSGLSSSLYVTAVTSSTPAAGDPGCSATQTLTFPRSSGTSQVIALPFGTWKLYYGSALGAKTIGVANLNVALDPATRGSISASGVLIDARKVPTP
ncbi:MAG: hypothetical protein INR66_24450, partial [Gordonia polyisoprenivorans]|nr:hypothetical protein [Gordonia polyisoprenivorans]